MTTAAQPYTSLLDPFAFPPFLSCPHEYKISSAYYLRPSPIRHWCFLGEIESISGIGRLCLDVRDREGTPARIYFYLDRLSPSVVEVVMTFGPRHGITYPNHPNCPQHLIQKGNNIAVLYAQQPLLYALGGNHRREYGLKTETRCMYVFLYTIFCASMS